MLAMKRTFAQAFPSFSTYYAAGNQVYNAFKRARSGSGFFSYGSGNTAMAGYRGQRRRLSGRFRTRTVTRQRRRQRGRSTRNRVRRIWKFMRNKGLRHIETKYTDNNFESTGTATSPNRITILENGAAITHKIWLTDITQGTARSQRIGKKVFLKAIKLRMYLQAPPQSDDPEVFVPPEVFMRIVVVREKEALANTGSGSNVNPYVYHLNQNIMKPNDNAAPEGVISGDSRRQFVATMFKYYGNKYADNYTVLHDKIYKIANEGGGQDFSKVIRKNIQVKQPCNWDDSQVRGDGHCYLFAYCDITSVPETSGNIPLLYVSYRTTFTDV